MRSRKPTVCFVLGTRPEIIKLAPVMKECESRRVPYFIIHTNQHYDFRLDAIFFKELGVRAADYNLRIGSGSHGSTTGRMIEGIEKVLLARRPDIVVVQGDTNTVLAGAVAASKLRFCSLAHVEAGLRSYDREMPEEVNRIVADHVSDYLFCPTTVEAKMLSKEGMERSKVWVTGNTIVDAVREYANIAPANDLVGSLGLAPGSFLLLTCHRPSNTDNKAVLSAIMSGVQDICDRHGVECVFPAHPRTAKALRKFKIKMPRSVRLIDPLGYLELLQLQKAAKAILTDSGGIQEEACILKRKCLILRVNTERPETLAVGGAMLVPHITRKDISATFSALMRKKVSWRNPFGDGKASKRILDAFLSS